MENDNVYGFYRIEEGQLRRLRIESSEKEKVGVARQMGPTSVVIIWGPQNQMQSVLNIADILGLNPTDSQGNILRTAEDIKQLASQVSQSSRSDFLRERSPYFVRFA